MSFIPGLIQKQTFNGIGIEWPLLYLSFPSKKCSFSKLFDQMMNIFIIDSICFDSFRGTWTYVLWFLWIIKMIVCYTQLNLHWWHAKILFCKLMFPKKHEHRQKYTTYNAKVDGNKLLVIFQLFFVLKAILAEW